MKILAYLLYGSKAEYRAELTFSVLTALRWLGAGAELKIVVLTDQPYAFAELPVETLALNAAEMAAWTQNGAYMHRAKPLALLKVLREYGAATALVDTDTYFKDDPQRLFERIRPGRSLLHDRDGYTLAGAAEWGAVVGAGIVPGDAEMLNSGVIGVDPADTALVEAAVALIDEIRAVAPVFNAEQVGVSLALQRRSEIDFCADIVEHYWGYLRPFLLLEVQRFLDLNEGKDAAELIALSASVRKELPEKRLVDRVLAKALTRVRGWSPGYGYAYLCYRTGLACAGKDRQIASLWIAAALHALRQCGATPGEIRRDFVQLRPEKLDTMTWLDVKVKRECSEQLGELVHASG